MSLYHLAKKFPHNLSYVEQLNFRTLIREVVSERFGVLLKGDISIRTSIKTKSHYRGYSSDEDSDDRLVAGKKYCGVQIDDKRCDIFFYIDKDDDILQQDISYKAKDAGGKHFRPR